MNHDGPRHSRKPLANGNDPRSQARCVGFNQFRRRFENPYCPRHEPTVYATYAARHRKSGVLIPVVDEKGIDLGQYVLWGGKS